MNARPSSNRKPTRWVALVLLVLVNHLWLPLHLALEHHCIGYDTEHCIGHDTEVGSHPGHDARGATDDGHPPHPIEDHADDRPDPATRSDLDRVTDDDQPVDRVGTSLLAVAPHRFLRVVATGPDPARAPPLETKAAPRAPPGSRSPRSA